MTLVGADRDVVEVNLVRGAPEAPSYAGLYRVSQKLARGLGEFLGSLMAAPATVSACEIRLEEEPLTDDLVVRHVRLAPLERSVALVMNRAALMRLVDLYYGGEGLKDARREQLSRSETRFYTRIAVGFSELLGAAWQPLALLEARLDEDANDVSGPAMIQAFTITFGEHGPFEIECRYPASIADELPGLHSAAPVVDPVADHGWQARLMDCALSVNFPVHAIFAEPELSVARLMQLRAGDIIPVCLPAQIDLIVAGLRIARGSAGESNGRAAICIEQF